MKATTRVNLHCHSSFSDGTLTPREIADALAGDGVAAAALTDHDSVDGIAEFSRALARRGVGHVSGVEITVQCRGEEAHLLGYGLDPAHPELEAILPSLREGRPPDVQSIAGSIRGKSNQRRRESPAVTAVPNGRIDIADAIGIIHRAGGRAFLAHPLVLQPDFRKLESLLVALKDDGLDGIEAIYEPFTDEERKRLTALAARLGLLVSAGTDIHTRKPRNHSGIGVDMPTELWKEFRDAVCSGNSQASSDSSASSSAHPRRRFEWRHFAFHFVFPTLLAIVLFVTAIYAFFIPAFERSLLDRKREMIRELTNSAWSILAGCERDARAGRMSRAEAKLLAKSRIESIRYGREGKDYFWLQDMHPRIIMHPYRKELNGQDVSEYRDPRGTRIFVEFANLVRQRREGYIEYVWQWKDDPNRLAAKESYIRGFKPWGWIIGTGIYIEDVKREINRVERNLVHASLAISVIVVLLLLYVMRQSLRLEGERSEAEESLRESTERYRSLLEATSEGMLLVMDGRCRYANHVFLEMLGCTQHELELLDISDVFPGVKENENALGCLKRLAAGDESVEGFEGVVRRRDGALVECVLSAGQTAFAERSGFILLTRNVTREKRATEMEAMIDRLQTSLLFLHEPVGHVGRSTVFVRLDTPIDSAVARMNAQESSAALVQSDDGTVVGIVTDRDIRERVFAAGVDRNGPVAGVMSAPLVTIPERAEVYEALLMMEQKGIQHLAVADEAGRVVGVIRNQELLQFKSYGPIVLTREVEHAATPSDVVNCCRRVPGLARSLLNCAAHPRHVTRMISSVCDAATVRLIALAEAEIGPSPVPFAFLALGSHGRQEMTLASDQDNAIVYAPPSDDSALPDIENHLNELGKFVCTWLDGAGYPFCRGDVMAQNPRWCKPLPMWKQYFSEWIERAEPQQLLEFSIFFDFRAVSGSVELARELRGHVIASLRNRASFFPHFAQDALLFKPPMRLFGRILVGGAGSDHSGLLDLKEALMPIVSFARLYALRHELDDTHTLDRLESLAAANVLPESSYQEIVTAYDFLMRLRLQHQSASQPSSESPDNTINYRRLGHLEETLLNQSFAQIAAIQKRISYDFLGGT